MLNNVARLKFFDLIEIENVTCNNITVDDEKSADRTRFKISE